MKIILSIILSALLIFLTQTFLTTWWLFAIVTFLVAVVIKQRSGWIHFITGTLPVFIVWMILYYRADMPNDSVLSNKIAALFSMPNHHFLFIIASAIMGIAGGLTAVAGGTIRKSGQSKEKK